MPKGSNIVQLAGSRFGKLTVFDRGEGLRFPNSKPRVTWRCRCDCGAIVEKLGCHLLSGRVTSCGSACPLRAVSLEHRFLSQIDKNGPTPAHRPELGPCWVWTGAVDRHGYGRVNVGPLIMSPRNDRIVRAHRAAFFLAHERWPEPCALHHCDNPSCVKATRDELGPAHIFEGTHKDNTDDMVGQSRVHRDRVPVLHGAADAASGRVGGLRNQRRTQDMSAAVCSKCHGRFAPSDYDFKRKICERLGKPYTPPKVCFECVTTALLTMPTFDEMTEDEQS